MKKPTPEQILGWLDSHNIEYKVRGDEVYLANPFYHNDKFKLCISLSKAVTHDWRTSEYDMTFVKFVMKYSNLNWSQAWKNITGSNYIYHKIDKEDKIQIDIKLPDGSYPISDNKIPQMRSLVINYMKKRAINYDTLINYNIYYNIEPIVIFPYMEWDRIVYWQSRSIIDKIFDFAKGTSKSEYLFGFDNCDIKNTIIIVESAINVMSIGRNALAVSGSSISDTQVSKLRLLDPIKIILAPDNDKAGRNFIMKSFFKLKKQFDTSLLYYILPPDQRDWNDILIDGINVQKYILNNYKKLNLLDLMRL